MIKHITRSSFIAATSQAAVRRVACPTRQALAFYPRRSWGVCVFVCEWVCLSVAPCAFRFAHCFDRAQRTQDVTKTCAPTCAQCMGQVRHYFMLCFAWVRLKLPIISKHLGDFFLYSRTLLSFRFLTERVACTQLVQTTTLNRTRLQLHNTMAVQYKNKSAITTRTVQGAALLPEQLLRRSALCFDRSWGASPHKTCHPMFGQMKRKG